MRVPIPSLLAAIVFALITSSMSAQQAGSTPGPRFESAVSSDSTLTRQEKTVFRPDTPRIFILYGVVDAVPGTRLRAVWYAEKVEGFDANAKLADLATHTDAGKRFMGSFSCNKPPKGWWLGLYRVELLINDKPARKVSFRVDTGAS